MEPKGTGKKVRTNRQSSKSIDTVAKMLMSEFPNRPHVSCATGGSKNLALILALRERGATFATIARILQAKYGERINPQSIARHLREVCLCPR